MIAQRFRSLAGLVGVALAALFFYILSLQVATERGRLEEVDRQIAGTQREIRRLQTELGTRASLRQLERWNSEALALGSPEAGQYLAKEQDIALIDQLKPGKLNAIPPAATLASVREEDPLNAGEGEGDAVAMLGGSDEDVQQEIAGAKGEKYTVQAASAASISPVKQSKQVGKP
jgi:hypothetical protein